MPRFLDGCPPTPNPQRVPINIDPDVRARLQSLLYQPEMRQQRFPPGYSAFINRACELAEREIAATRAELSPSEFGITEIPGESHVRLRK